MGEDSNPAMPDIVALLDQAASGLRDFAPLLKGYFDALVEAGFTPYQALHLVAGYQQGLFTQQPGPQA